ncbi:hypothetical protein Poly24_53560 [Rosistilla carotiformis]|uniref:Uncharacterized protein n=1 Tax=Rosistilla carotiformis TaxID=2528017 RepID=A0A518K1H2_9BACT|nr:hypothetical protein [Rosistilla carotiformis]QDV71617.1 hypothetical protein Poly24_53560 [Rosistilla carotiformis]
MIHYSCDRCKCEINPDEELRYSVQVEIKAVFDTPAGIVDDADTDHLLELHEILERLGDDESDAIGEDVYQRRRYDLCSGCFRQYQKNPLGRESSLSFGFSDN